MTPTLDLKLRNEIDDLFISSYDAYKANNPDEMMRLADIAWSKIPDSKFSWDVSWSFVQSMVYTYIDFGNMKEALNLIDLYIDSGYLFDYEDGPFFLKGKVLFLMNRKDQSFEFFDKANSISKGRCFKDEDDKYLKFYLSEKD